MTDDGDGVHSAKHADVIAGPAGKRLSPGTRPFTAAMWLRAAALGFGAFLLLALAVSLGSTRSMDSWGLLLLRNTAEPSVLLGPAWLQETGRDFSGLASNGVMTVLIFTASGLLALSRRSIDAWFLLVSFSGALALEMVAKFCFARPRPDLVPHAARIFTASFPSAHATISAATCLAAALLLARAQPERRFVLVLAAAGISLVTLVGVSRIYLGVHWPTDVAAGWALGAGWTALCWAAVKQQSAGG